MLIRKLFKFEGAHIVRDCSSDRCKKSIHGHSYLVELFIKSNQIDNGQMVVDFGLLKGSIKDIVDSFDHAYSMWEREDKEYKDFFKKNSERWVEMPVSPSAEMYALMFYAIFHTILYKTKWNNGEKDLLLNSVRVHETATGWAEAFYEDYLTLWYPRYNLSDIKISKGIQNEWKDPKLWEHVLDPTYTFTNPEIELKYQR